MSQRILIFVNRMFCFVLIDIENRIIAEERQIDDLDIKMTKLLKKKR